MTRLLSTTLALTLLLPAGALAQDGTWPTAQGGCQALGPTDADADDGGLVCARPEASVVVAPGGPAPSPMLTTGSELAATESAAPLDPMAAPAVSADEAVGMIESGERVVIDVRTPAEYEAARVPGALNVDVSAWDFADRIASLDPAGSYLVYCRSGNRSAIAAEQMAAMGLDVVDARGLADLARAGAPIE